VFSRLTQYRKLFIVGTHVGVFALSLVSAFLLRFDFAIPGTNADLLRAAIPVFVAVKLAVFFAFRQYSGWWRYVTLGDVLAIGRAAAVSAIALAGIIYIAGLRQFPRSIFVIDAVMTIAMLSAIRVALRLLRERLGRTGSDRRNARRVLVVGAGPTAEELLREAQRNPSLGVRVVGVICLDPEMLGARLHSVPVLGLVDDIDRLVRELEIDQVISAGEAGHGDDVRRVVGACRSADVPHRVLPPKSALLEGTVAISSLREVSIQDLLGRPPVRLDSSPIAEIVNGATVLVTGAGGSIGSEICRQVARFGPARLVLVEQSELPLFSLDRELRAAFPEVRLEPVIADVAEYERIEAVMRHFHPRFVLHAAAHKHVPLMEMNPGEAIKNNIGGTLNVVRAAQAAEVEVAVLISTDKAVNPTSVMGASKRVSEMVTQALAPTSGTRLCAVRFGNVLGSSGSVIPIFQQQIRTGGPVTVTHPDMRRYFMTIPEATQLVLQAASFAAEGEIFVLDMGEPVRILDVARDLIRLSGLEPDRDIPIVFSGIRPGEKLFEELSTDEESNDRTEHDRIFRCKITPPSADHVLRAVTRLDELARADLAAPQLRRALFEVLGILEQRGTTEAIDSIAENVIHLDPTTARIDATR
jgi:FlaA1/EpsC-like NDP-sugar epimerase